MSHWTPWIILAIVVFIAVLGYFFIPSGSALARRGDDDEWGSAA